MSDTGATSGAERRLGEIAGDRPCVRCGFNLRGQAIVREAHYGLIMARCPECAQVAALQEYPSLGRWAGRLGGTLAAMWLVLVVLGVLMTGAALHRLARQTAIDVLHPAAMRLGEAYREFAVAKAELITDPVQRQQSLGWFTQYTVEQWPMVGPDYIGTPEYHSAMASLPGGTMHEWAHARSAGWTVLAGVGLGILWAVGAPHLRRRGQAVLVAVLLLSALGWWGLELGRGSTANVWGSYYWSTDLVFLRHGAALMPIGLAAGGAGLMVGMLIGRPIARGLVRLLLPPRLRAPLGGLWTLQGLDVPGAGRK